MPDTVSDQPINAPSGRMSSSNKKPLIGIKEVKQAASFLLGAWALKKFPKTAIVGLIGVGVLLGLTIKEVAKRVDSSGGPKDHLH